EDEFSGVVDLIDMKMIEWEGDTLGATPAITDIPETLAEAAATARASMIEAIAEADDEAMRAYLEERPMDGAFLRASLRPATGAGGDGPALRAPAFKHKS